MGTRMINFSSKLIIDDTFLRTCESKRRILPIRLVLDWVHTNNSIFSCLVKFIPVKLETTVQWSFQLWWVFSVEISFSLSGGAVRGSAEELQLEDDLADCATASGQSRICPREKSHLQRHQGKSAHSQYLLRFSPLWILLTILWVL